MAGSRRKYRGPLIPAFQKFALTLKLAECTLQKVERAAAVRFAGLTPLGSKAVGRAAGWRFVGCCPPGCFFLTNYISNRDFRVYLLYLDDSGSPGNANEQYFVLGGLAVFERQAFFLTQEIEKLAEKYCPDDPDSVEFHASEVFGGRRAPWSGLDRAGRIIVLQEMLSVLANDRFGAFAYAVAVHKPSYPNDDPVKLAFEELCNRFDLQLKTQNNQVESKERQRGLIILDKSTYETTLQGLSRDFRKTGTRWGVTRNLADVPMFVDSKASRLVQLADHIAYSVFRFYEANDATYLNVVQSKFYADMATGKLHGFLHKQTHNPRCWCPPCLSRKLIPNSRDTSPEEDPAP